jgi:hypothetical protein
MQMCDKLQPKLTEAVNQRVSRRNGQLLEMWNSLSEEEKCLLLPHLLLTMEEWRS